MEQWLGSRAGGLELFSHNKVCTLNKKFVHNFNLE